MLESTIHCIQLNTRHNKIVHTFEHTSFGMLQIQTYISAHKFAYNSQTNQILMISLSPSVSVTSSSSSYYIIDSLLFGINLFNFFVLFTYLQPVESPLKTSLVNLKYRIVSKVHSTPLVVSTTLSALLYITTTSFIKYLYDVSSSNEMLIRTIISGYTFVVTCIFQAI